MQKSTMKWFVAPLAALMLMPTSLAQSANAADPDDGVVIEKEAPEGSGPVIREQAAVRDSETREIEGKSNAEVRDMLREFNNDYDNDAGVSREQYSREEGARLRHKMYDSKVPTYNYGRVWFNKRATYLLGRNALAASLIAGALTGWIPNVYAKAATSVLAVGSGATSIFAKDAQNNRLCVAFSFYIRKPRYWGMNLPGPEVAPRSVYQTDTNCTGRYGAS